MISTALFRSGSILNSMISYFPIRLMIFASIVGYLLLINIQSFQTLEENMLYHTFKFFGISSWFEDDDLYVGNVFSPVRVIPTVHAQSLFFMFLISLIFTASININIRLKIALWTSLLFLVFIVGQFTTVISLLALGSASEVSVLRTTIVVNGFSSGAVVELMFFTILTLPRSSKIRPIIRRSYRKEYLYFGILIGSSVLVLYLLLEVLDIREDSLVSAYFTLQIPTVFSFRFYLAYLLAELKTPGWAKKLKEQGTTHPPVSILVPAYNESKTITRLIESLDKAASRYKGTVEIVFVNDGSTDNTGELAARTFRNLKHATYKQYNISNSGKGYALKFGLEHCSGEIIFRLDGDSIMDSNAIQPMVNHFGDPSVGSVSGMLFPTEIKSLWQKSMVLYGCNFIFYRRGDQITDTILVQPGAYTVFRKEVLLKIGGWIHDQLGEDGEITTRLGRYGYRNEFEERSVVYSRLPETLQGLRKQRVRWSIAFFHSRKKNVKVIKDFAGPRSLAYMIQLVSHGGNFPSTVFIPFAIMSVLFGLTNIPLTNLPTIIGIPVKLVAIQLFISAAEMMIFTYFLNKYGKLHYLKYIPFLPIFRFVLAYLFRPEGLGILLHFSSKFKNYNQESFEYLRQSVAKISGETVVSPPPQKLPKG